MAYDYTPTTRTVRGVYAMPQPELLDEPQRAQVREDREAMFDRWLAAHDAELLERARVRIEQSFDRAYDDRDPGDIGAFNYALGEGYRQRNNQVIRVLALEIDRLRNQETK